MLRLWPGEEGVHGCVGVHHVLQHSPGQPGPGAALTCLARLAGRGDNLVMILSLLSSLLLLLLLPCHSKPATCKAASSRTSGDQSQPEIVWSEFMGRFFMENYFNMNRFCQNQCFDPQKHLQGVRKKWILYPLPEPSKRSFFVDTLYSF